MEKMDEKLNKAIQVSKNAYCPYSNYSVGCCLESADGELFLGCNVESASYGATLCAERNALANAISQGKRKFKSITLYAESETHPIPCGICRQLLSEFGNMDVYVYNNKKQLKQYTLLELFPEAFTL